MDLWIWGLLRWNAGSSYSVSIIISREKHESLTLRNNPRRRSCRYWLLLNPTLLLKRITEVAMIRCLFHNDLFAKKRPRAKFAIAALRMFGLQHGNLLFVLEYMEIKISHKLFGQVWLTMYTSCFSVTWYL